MSYTPLSKNDYNKFKRIDNKYKYTYPEYAKYFNIPSNLITKLRKPYYKKLSFENENYNLIQKLLNLKKYPMSEARKEIPVTKELLDKIKYLKEICQTYAFLSTKTGISKFIIQKLLNGEKRKIDINLIEIINTQYEEATGNLELFLQDLQNIKTKNRKPKFYNNINIELLIKQDNELTLKENKKHYRALKINNSYKIYYLVRNNVTNQLVPYEIIKGTVIKEYPHFYSIKCKNTYTTVLKNDLFTKLVTVKEIGEKYD